MTITHSAAGDRCPYELASGSMAGCARFEPRVVFERSTGSIATCAHVRSAIADPGDGTAATFYPRCELRTGEIDTERTFVVPMD
jgi:hypothetical protein